MRKLTFGYVKEVFEKEGYQLLSTQYIDAHHKLEFICPQGHKNNLTWAVFQQGSRCALCDTHNKHTIEMIQSFMEKEGYKLLSTDYVRAGSHIQVQCPKGHIVQTTWTYFKNGGNRCGECFGTKKYSLGEVQEIFEEKGFTLLAKEYKGIHQKLDCTCSQGHTTQIPLLSLKQGSGCAKCYGNVRHSFDYIVNLFQKEGYKLLSKTYKNTHQPLQYECPKGHVNWIRTYSFTRGERCSDCWQWRRQRELGEILGQLYPEQILLKRNNLGFLNKQKVDYALPHLKIVIEYDGEQHYNPVVGCFGVKTLKEAKRRLKKYQQW